MTSYTAIVCVACLWSGLLGGMSLADAECHSMSRKHLDLPSWGGGSVRGKAEGSLAMRWNVFRSDTIWPFCYGYFFGYDGSGRDSMFPSADCFFSLWFFFFFLFWGGGVGVLFLLSLLVFTYSV